MLRRPEPNDAHAVFQRYSSDRVALKYVGWPAHDSEAATRSFLAFSDAEWRKWPAGPLLILSRAEGRLLGSTGLAFETTDTASTGYVLASDAWGQGYATEALDAVVALAGALGVRRLTALCHAEHHASARVLEKAGFTREAWLASHTVFPNLGVLDPQPVLLYAIQPARHHVQA
ncbi:MAG TPA: GNAT family protein [Steroidobacteraceae bacterium]|nr:GNAT family protein [Steroidobacteraceae bacterium]